ncbi:MAG: COR domain-containing protein [Thermodesulfobacteriota bacterium]|nr:COR domain-containing protein [Thermodesulfobacteriota bacterium]
MKSLVLVVDDNLLNLKLLTTTLDNHGYRTLMATDGPTARQFAVTEKPDLILLDVKMPDEDGFEVIKQLKSNPVTASIPVILISGMSELESMLTGFELGAVDYITKPFHPLEVLARIRNHLLLSVSKRLPPFLGNSQDHKYSIIVVDDNILDRKLLATALDDNGYKTFMAKDGLMARKLAESELPDLILLDVNMPDEDGFEVTKQLKSNPVTASIPVILISGMSELESMFTGFELGAVDYITKPFHPLEVLARIRIHLSLNISIYTYNFFHPTPIERYGNSIAPLFLNIKSEANILALKESELNRLVSLRITGLCMKALPPIIYQLKNLKVICLRHSHIESFEKFSHLKNIVVINFSNNQLNNLPSEIYKLSALKGLYADNNRLIKLPPDISFLSQLTIIDINNNELDLLPQEIGKLSELKILDLSSNQLTKLPPEIGQLENLTELYLGANQLTELPPEICQLKNLIVLDIRSNHLTALPSDIWKLEKLQYLVFEGNPIEQPPIEILRRGTTDVKNYFRQTAKLGKALLCEAKLLIVGEAGAGKTTFSKKLIDSNYKLRKREPSTEGIDILRWEFPLSEVPQNLTSDDKGEFRVNIWDFGGQEIYHATHQFFLTQRSLYALVADARRQDTDFYYWLNTIELLGGKSPLIIIKNEKEDRYLEIDECALRGRFVVLKETFTTNLETNKGLNEILLKVKHYISNLPHIGSILPTAWINVRRSIEDISSQRNYINIDEYIKICDQHGIKEKNDKFQLLSYMHDLGICLHFRKDPLLRKTIIINPEWVTKGIYKVLDNEKIIKNLGQFNYDQLTEIWDEVAYAAMPDELLQLMINFKLCYQIPTNDNVYVTPQLLSKRRPTYDWNTENNLVLRYAYNFMPKGLFTRFIVNMHNVIDNNIAWRSGVVLKNEGARAEVIEYYHDREIKIRVNGRDRKEFMAIVAWEIDKINEQFERLNPDKLIPCNCETCKNSSSPHFYQMSVLKDFIGNGQKTIQCQKKPYVMVNILTLIDDATETKNKKTNMKTLNEPKKIFISYSHLDNNFLEKLHPYLKPLEDEGLIDYWDDTRIKPGMKWREEIQTALATTNIAILLVSSNFLASDFIVNNEIPPLLKAAEKDGTTILSVILNPCKAVFSKSKLEQFQTINPPDKPLSGMNSHKRGKVFDSLVNLLIYD